MIDQKRRAARQPFGAHRARAMVEHLRAEPALDLGLTGESQLHRARFGVDSANLARPAQLPLGAAGIDLLRRHRTG